MNQNIKEKDHTLFILVAILVLVCLFFGLRSTLKVDIPSQAIPVGTEYDVSANVNFIGLDFSWLVKPVGEINTHVVGNYTVKYKTFFGTNLFEHTYKVVDTLDPEISLVGEKDIIVYKREDFVDPGVIAMDNYDGDLTSSVTSSYIETSPNSFDVLYSVVDSSGNSATTSRTVTIKAGTVYLTFDDGPSLDITPKILDILKEKNVTATFFVVGFGDSKIPIIQRMLEEGHTIGLHGNSHEYAKIYKSLDVLMDNFYKVESLVSDATGGYSSKFIRFPGGSSNTISKSACPGIMSEAVKYVEEQGYTYFDWNVDSRDAGGAKTAEDVFNNVINGISTGNNIVLMHDSSGHKYTLDALESIIDYCINNHYEVKAIDSTTKPIHHKTAN